MVKKNNFIIAEHFKGLIFDCDGTLVDSMPLHMQAWQAAFDKYQAVYDEDFLSSLCGMRETDVIEQYNHTYGTNLDSNLMVRSKHEFFRRHIADIKPVEPVVKIVRDFYGKKPLAVVSGSVRNHVQAQLKAIGLLGLFEFILTADDPFKPKPAPDLFIEAARRMKLAPAECLVFEDGDAGFTAATNAGMEFVDIKDLIE
jgi:HAD superfamily hydrolase (TIGR01509 family)